MPSAQAPYAGRAAKPEWPVLLAVFVVGFVLIASRLPDVIFNSQFYIEDGFFWYAQAHDLGTLEALTLPHRGYLVIVQRLGGSLASAFPLLWAPLVMALFGIALNVLPAVFVASSRFAALVPSLPRRLFLAFLCLAAPNAWSVMSNTTNAMWYLGLLACLVVLASPPTRPAWRAFDLAAVVLSGLSGPFAILLAPVAALKWWFRRERWTLVLLLATTVVGLVQAASILVAREEHMQLGADALKLVSLLVRRVIYEALFGQVGGMRIMLHEWGDFWTQSLTIALAGLAGLAMLVYTMLRAPLELRLFIAYAGLTLASGIAWPGPPVGDTLWWDLLTPASNGNRYFLLPGLAFIITCAWMAMAKPVPVRAAGVSLLAVALMVGVPLNWREPAHRDFEFPAAVKRYQAAPVGAKVVIMTPPDHAMTITKKAGEPVVLVPDECTGDMLVAAKLLVSNQMTWNGGEGRAEGTDPYAIFGLPARLRVCGVRVEFVLTSLTGAPMLLQMWWAESGAQGFTEHERNSMVLVTPGPEPQAAVFHVRDTIDRIRLDPGITPGTVFELREVILLRRWDDQRR
jgi:hypothetical protein